MYQLVIDTSQDHMIFGLLENKSDVFAFQVIEAVRKQSDIMVESLNQFLLDNNTNLSQIDALICCVGPGSFVGVRVGLTFVKIMATQFDLPVYAYTSLEGLKVGDDCIIALDAKGKKQYVQVYTNNHLTVENGLYTEQAYQELVESLPNHKISTIDNFDVKLYFYAIVELLHCRKEQEQIDLLEPVYLK